MNKKSRPDAVVTRQVQQEATTHCGSEFENQNSVTLTKEAIVLICDSTGRNEILGKIALVVVITAK